METGAYALYVWEEGLGSSDYVRIPRLLLLSLLKSRTYNLPSALYIRNDPYETSDAVFGVKKSLIVDFTTAAAETAKQFGVKEGTKLLKHDFVLVDEKETEMLRDENALKAMKALGRRVKLLNHLPVPDLD
jgi:hypothetical protein